MIFSNGQFDADEQLYIFNRETRMFEKSDTMPLDTVVLHYKSFPKSDSSKKGFRLTLFDNDKNSEVLKVVEKTDGTIYRSGSNIDYYTEIENMRKKAGQFLLEKKGKESIEVRIQVE